MGVKFLYVMSEHTGVEYLMHHPRHPFISEQGPDEILE